MKDLFLGIDTSNYTTSLSLCDGEGKCLCNLKKLLPVKENNVGLRQSDAVFEHTRQMPELFEALSPFLAEGVLRAVGVSEKPRRAEGSYMPCFLVGVNAAAALSVTHNIPLYRFSHQDGHLMAALYGADALTLKNAPFLAFHVSGGTTDVLHVGGFSDGFDVKHLGTSLDLHAGQAIDRCGVMLGCSFPSGKEIEALALAYEGKTGKKKICVSGCDCNLSGLQNVTEKMKKDGKSREEIAATLLDFLSRTLWKMTENAQKTCGDLPVLYSGGVMSNVILQKDLGKLPDTYFAPAAYSCDNAAGIALLAREKYLSQ